MLTWKKSIRIKADIAPLLEKIYARKQFPFLIVYPSSALGVWKAKMKSNFKSINARYFDSSKARTGLKKRSKVIRPRLHDLIKYIASLPNNPRAFLNGVLSSYQTWNIKSMHWSEGY